MEQRVHLKEAVSKVIGKGWIILLLVAVFGLGARLFSAHFIDKVYQGKTTMFIGKEQGSPTSITLTDIEASNRLIVDYKEIANSRLVIGAVMENLGLQMELKDFRKALSLDIIDNSRLLSLGFSSKDPVLAASVANEMARELSQAVSEIVDVSNIRIIDPALVPTEPVSPKLNVITLLAGVLGLIAGLLFIYFDDLFNDSYGSQEEIEADLGLDVAAVIPRARKGKKSPADALVRDDDLHSLLAESYKILRTSMTHLNRDDTVFILTSPVAAQEKTRTSCNLAVSMARDQKKALLIDGDLRRPGVYEVFRINRMPGLTDVLYGAYGLTEAVQSAIDVPGLDVLTSGRLTPMTAELLGSDAFKKLIDEARARYDIVIIDAPPVLNVSDTAVLSKIADKVLLVVPLERTNRALVREAKKSLEKVCAKAPALILADVPIDPRSFYYGGDSVGRRRRPGL